MRIRTFPSQRHNFSFLFVCFGLIILLILCFWTRTGMEIKKQRKRENKTAHSLIHNELTVVECTPLQKPDNISYLRVITHILFIFHRLYLSLLPVVSSTQFIAHLCSTFVRIHRIVFFLHYFAVYISFSLPHFMLSPIYLGQVNTQRANILCGPTGYLAVTVVVTIAAVADSS